MCDYEINSRLKFLIFIRQMSQSGRSSLSRKTTLRESTPEFRSRLMRDQRTLSTMLTKLDVERSTQARLREDEIRQLKRELRSGLQTTTTPLDDMRIPGARLTELADRIRDGRGQ